MVTAALHGRRSGSRSGREIDRRAGHVVAVFHAGDHQLPLLAQLLPIGGEEAVEPLVKIGLPDVGE